MNRSELVKAVAERVGSEEPAARRHVDAVVETVMERVSAGERVIITGFGTFDRVSRPARKARNPRTGLPIEVPAAEVPRFRVGQTFRNRVNPVGQSVSVPEEEATPEPVVALVAEKTPSKKSKDGKAVKDSKAIKTVKSVKGGKKAKKGLEKPKGEKGAGKATKRPGKAKASAKPAKPAKVGKASKAAKVGK
ncbi:HU family DNA-binding protein [Actinomadura chibensis]|uniref:HU family DNA-binding protein n=1 Tax=Actinomadura chibensis TaxID=392828 RepID=A0A5D0NKU4_9ACTN|nr:HU family DNA-binding protein [Actinomadura chibensis]TYB44868.1 HU family DNA-binding protein [Actinomadura chibensis]